MINTDQGNKLCLNMNWMSSPFIKHHKHAINLRIFSSLNTTNIQVPGNLNMSSPFIKHHKYSVNLNMSSPSLNTTNIQLT